MEIEEFKKLYTERYKIEAKNSELKSNFGYYTANACGKNGITIQGASALFLANIKRIIKLKEEKAKNNGQKYPIILCFLKICYKNREFWWRGYYVDTVGKKYKKDKRMRKNIKKIKKI